MALPEIDRLKSVIANARQAAPTATAEEGQRITADLTAALDAATTALTAAEQRDAARQGDDAREQLSDIEAFEQKRFGRVRYEQGSDYFETVHTLAGQYDLLAPIPTEIAGHPYAKYLHLPSQNEDIRRLQQLHDSICLAKAYTGKDYRELPKLKGMYEDLLQRATIVNPTTTGYGSDWVPSFFSATMVEDVYQDAVLLNVFPHFAMPRQNGSVPQLLTLPTAWRATGATTIADFGNPNSPISEITTGNVDFAAERVQIILGFAEESEEDMITAVSPILRRQAAKGVRVGLENAIVNGSTLLTDLDNADATAANKLWAITNGVRDVRASWDGLRKDSLVTASSGVDAGGTTAFASSDLIAAMGQLGKYAAEDARNSCLWIAGIDAQLRLLLFTELITIDKYGANATIKTGEIGSIFGIPLIVSGQVYGPYQGTGLNAAGKWDNTTKTATTMLLVNTDAYWMADRRAMRVESERSVIGAMTAVVCSGRWDFQKMLPAASKTCSAIYNIIP